MRCVCKEGTTFCRICIVILRWGQPTTWVRASWWHTKVRITIKMWTGTPNTSRRYDFLFSFLVGILASPYSCQSIVQCMRQAGILCVSPKGVGWYNLRRKVKNSFISHVCGGSWLRTKSDTFQRRPWSEIVLHLDENINVEISRRQPFLNNSAENANDVPYTNTEASDGIDSWWHNANRLWPRPCDAKV